MPGGNFNEPMTKLDTNGFQAKDTAYFLANPGREYYARTPHEIERTQHEGFPLIPGNLLYVVIKRGHVNRNKPIQLPADIDPRMLSDKDIKDILAATFGSRISWD